MPVQSARFVAEHKRSSDSEEGTRAAATEISIYGQEKTGETVKLCRMNLGIHGLEGDVRGANSYYEDLHQSNRHVARRIAERKTLQPWDVLIEAAGGTKGQITGRTVLLRPQLFHRSEFPITCASFSRFIRFRTDLCDPAFMFWYLQYLYEAGFMHAYHTQHTGVSRFQWTTFSEREPLSLPCLPVQRQIASILSAYDDLIENNLRRIRILEEMARSIYRELFVNFRFPGNKTVPRVDSSLGPIPQGWQVRLVKDILVRRSSGTEYREADVVADGPTPVVDQSTNELLGFHDNKPDHLASPERPIAIFGDHTCKMQLLVEPFSVGPNVVPFAAVDEFPTGYVFYVLRDLARTQEYKRHWTPLNAKEVVVADNATAKRFASIIQPVLIGQELFRKKTRNLRRTRDLLLRRLLSGTVDIPGNLVPDSFSNEMETPDEVSRRGRSVPCCHAKGN